MSASKYTDLSSASLASIHSPFSVDHSRLSSLSLSPTSPTTFSSWQSTRHLSEELLRKYDTPGDSSIITLAKDCYSLQTNLQIRKNNLMDQYEFLKGRIKSRLELCRQSLLTEQEKLRSHEDNLRALEHDIDSVHQKSVEIKRNIDESKNRIEQFTHEASRESDGVDLVEEQKKDEVHRLQTQISMHAAATGIKWDYDRTDVLAGQVSIPSKMMHRRFEIELDKYTEFEVANKIWDMIEESP